MRAGKEELHLKATLFMANVYLKRDMLATHLSEYDEGLE